MVRSMSFSVPTGEKTEKKRISGNPSNKKRMQKKSMPVYPSVPCFVNGRGPTPFPVVIGMNGDVADAVEHLNPDGTKER